MRSRIRTIKPEFFQHEALYDAEQASGLPLRLAFSGLWCVADREGRFEWRPRALKANVLPFDDVDFEAILVALADAGFLTIYEVDGRKFVVIPSFPKHQIVNHREAKSCIPGPTEARPGTPRQTRARTGLPQVEGKGTEGKGTERNGTIKSKAPRATARGKGAASKDEAAPVPGEPKVTWLTPFGTAWLTLYPDGEPPWKFMAKYLAPLTKKHSTEAICAQMVAYFQREGQYATWPKFAAIFGNGRVVDRKVAAEDAQILAMVRDQQNRMMP